MYIYLYIGERIHIDKFHEPTYSYLEKFEKTDNYLTSGETYSSIMYTSCSMEGYEYST